MKLVMCAMLSVLCGSINAHAYVEKECQRKIVQFSTKFLKSNSQNIFNTEPKNLKFKFLSFSNPTPGSFDQEYITTIDVEWPTPGGNMDYTFGRLVTLKLYSPRICDRLEVRGISDNN
jgi:hypothetical protein